MVGLLPAASGLSGGGRIVERHVCMAKASGNGWIRSGERVACVAGAVQAVEMAPQPDKQDFLHETTVHSNNTCNPIRTFSLREWYP